MTDTIPTQYGDLTVWTTEDPQSLPAASAAMMTSVANALNKVLGNYTTAALLLAASPSTAGYYTATDAPGGFFYWSGSTWTLTGVAVVASTAIITAPQNGWRVQISGIIYRYSSSATAWFITPGQILQSGTISASAGWSIDNLTGATDYEIILNLPTASTGNDLGASLRLNGTADTSANYDRQTMVGAGAAAAGSNALAGTSWTAMASAARTDKTFTFRTYGLNLAQRTVIIYTVSTWDAAANANFVTGTLRHRSATAFNGFGFTPSTGTVTGTYEVRSV